MRAPFKNGKSLTGSVLNSLKAALPRQKGALQPDPDQEIDLGTLSKRIILPSLPITDEETACARYRAKGSKLARQENWEELSQCIQHAEDCRLHTPAGNSATLLLASGARHDVVAMAEDAIYDEAEPSADGIGALEEMLAEHYGDYACALVTALAHIDIGTAWRTAAQESDDQLRRLRFKEHFKRAEDILGTFDGVELDSPALAAAQCALQAARPRPGSRVVTDYEALIDLDPDCPHHMRALGQFLLPAQNGDHKQLEREGKCCVARTADIWGAGGYTWVYLDALALDADTLNHLDCDLFVQGMTDILSRCRNQHLTNLMAAFCAITMGPDAFADKLPAAAERTRKRLHGLLGDILTGHLRELHPMIWAQALFTPGSTRPLPVNNALVAKGRQIALRVIAEHFADEIAEGNSVAFSGSGMYLLPAQQ